MQCEIISKYYDIRGKKVSKLSSTIRKYFRPTHPIGRYLSQPLKVKCTSFSEIREFLKQCQYVSDKEQFGKIDYWMPPEDFEAEKKGDCEDFALWTWRQLIEMGCEARFVVGRAGKYGNGHAWICYFDEGQGYLLEPLAAWLSYRLPKLSTVRYEPYFSVSWDGKDIHFFEHQNNAFNPSVISLLGLIAEWLVFWSVHKPISIFMRIKYSFLRVKYLFGQLVTTEKALNR